MKKTTTTHSAHGYRYILTPLILLGFRTFNGGNDSHINLLTLIIADFFEGIDSAVDNSVVNTCLYYHEATTERTLVVAVKFNNIRPLYRDSGIAFGNECIL